MNNGSDKHSPVSPLSPVLPGRPSARYFTTHNTAQTHASSCQFPPRTSSLQKGVVYEPSPFRPTLTQKPLPPCPPVQLPIRPYPTSWNPNPAPHNGYTVTISSTNSSPARYPPPPLWPSPPKALSSIPLKLTTALTEALPSSLKRRQSRKRRGKKDNEGIWAVAGASSKHLPPRKGSPFPTVYAPNNPYNYHQPCNSFPTLSAPEWSSEGEDTDEEVTPTGTSKYERQTYSLENLGVYKPPPNGMVGRGNFPSRSNSIGNKNSVRLLAMLLCEHNTIVRIVRWLRAEDLHNLSTVSKRVRQYLLLSPTDSDVQDRRSIHEKEDDDTEGSRTDDESDRIYQLSPLSPMSPLTLRMASLRRASSEFENERNSAEIQYEFGSSPTDLRGIMQSTARNSLRSPLSANAAQQENSKFDSDLQNWRVNAAQEARYRERLGRLVWLLTLTALCKTPHRVREKKDKLKFCVWCGECVCAVSPLTIA